MASERHLSAWWPTGSGRIWRIRRSVTTSPITSPTYGCGTATAWYNPVVKNGVVTSVTSANFTPEIVNNTINRNVVTTLYRIEGHLGADIEGYP